MQEVHIIFSLMKCLQYYKFNFKIFYFNGGHCTCSLELMYMLNRYLHFVAAPRLVIIVNWFHCSYQILTHQIHLTSNRSIPQNKNVSSLNALLFSLLQRPIQNCVKSQCMFFKFIILEIN